MSHVRAYQAFQLMFFYFAGAFAERGDFVPALMNLGLAAYFIWIEGVEHSRTLRNHY